MDDRIIDDLAHLARIRLDEGARPQLLEQLAAILRHFEQLAEVDTEGVLPLLHAVDLAGRLRADEPAEFPGRDELLQNAPRLRDGCFEVPRIVE